MDEKSKEIIEKVERNIKEGKKVELEDSYGYTDKGVSKEYRFILDDKEEIDLLNYCFEGTDNVEEAVLEEIRELEDDAFDEGLHLLGFEYDSRARKEKLVNKYTRDNNHEQFILCTDGGLVYVDRFLKRFVWKYTGGHLRTWSFKLPILYEVVERIRDALEAKKEEAKRNSKSK